MSISYTDLAVPETVRNEEGAFHESGHVILAYLKGYRCKSVQLSRRNPGNGFTRFDYRDDFELIKAILSCRQGVESFNRLPWKLRRCGLGVAHSMLDILLAGSCAETVFRYKRNIEGDIPIDLSRTDIKKIEIINDFIELASGEYRGNLYKDSILQINSFLIREGVWDAVVRLSDGLLRSDELKLGQGEIESILGAVDMSLLHHA